MSTRAGRRRVGLLIPLFSCPTSTSWGIGDIGDLRPLSAWLAAGGQRVLQLLPLNEMASGQQSPYSAISAMAIDPIYIRVPDVPEFARAGGERLLTADERADLDRVQRSSRIDYAVVRRLKERALRAAFEVFYEHEWRGGGVRGAALTAFLADQAWWIDDYAVFRALHACQGNRAWTEWPEPLRTRDQEALGSVRRELAREILFFQYLQWIADTQWHAARDAVRANGVALFGDLPFMVDGDSADVWARQDEFRLDASVGVPPDAFSATGQDWGMPPYRWDVVAAGGFRWLRDRARRSAALYDGYRVDHLVGFYRTYSRPRAGGKPSFSPEREEAQRALGERVLELFREPGSEVIAEDLGTVPDFVRASLARSDVPGFRVFRWERHWHTEGEPFRDPVTEYPVVSVATSGTHDTEPLSVWWEKEDEEVRRKVNEIPTVVRISNGAGILDRPYNPAVRDVLLETLLASASDIVLLPIPDVFGWDARINEPATVSDANWSYRLPWPVDRFDAEPDARERQATLRRWAEKHGRLSGP
ncbi:MAG TPA: 4-alpha-glucanotransferase [Vicinamibacterales bacterium]|jgi:4-alpha-glucanotransferase